MREQTYAVVVYLHGPLARFVNDLRRELNREHASKLAHLSVLPPRPLIIPEQAALEGAQARCDEWDSFEVHVAGVSNFLPIKGVVYLDLGASGELMHRLHRTLNFGHLACSEPLPYIPHITIAQEMNPEDTQRVQDSVRAEWEAYKGPRNVRVERLTFVRLSPEGTWLDLAELQLGRLPVLAH